MKGWTTNHDENGGQPLGVLSVPGRVKNIARRDLNSLLSSGNLRRERLSEWLSQLTRTVPAGPDSHPRPPTTLLTYYSAVLWVHLTYLTVCKLLGGGW